jgi:hypothetical protein
MALAGMKKGSVDQRITCTHNDLHLRIQALEQKEKGATPYGFGSQR